MGNTDRLLEKANELSRRAYGVAFGDLVSQDVIERESLEAEALGDLGMVCFSTEEYHKAIEYYSQCLALASRTGGQ